MFESRCGVSCHTCERKKQVNCTGCPTMEQPFWGGECGVKTCCESKKHHHCGLCDEFPCDMLAAMGVEQGYDPIPRLERLKLWAEKQ